MFGVNDTLRSGFDPDRIAAAAMHTVGALRASGAEVLTMRLPDPGRMLGLPGALARPLARRAHQVNAVMDAVAERFGTLHFDAAGDAEVYDPRMWAVDRLHPSERGHRLIARRFHHLLAAAGLPVGPAPGPEPQPAAHPAGRTRLDGHQGNRVGGAPVHRPGAGLLAMAVREWLGRQAERPWAGQDAIMAPSWNPIGPSPRSGRSPRWPRLTRSPPLARPSRASPDGRDGTAGPAATQDRRAIWRILLVASRAATLYDSASVG